MPKPTLLDTTFAKVSELSSKARRALVFLIKNQNLVLLHEQDLQAISEIKIYVRTPITDFFQRIVDTDKLSSFALMNFTGISLDLPELLTMGEITIDGKYISDTSVPDKWRKPWVNITPLLSGKRDTYNGRVQINDVPGLCSLLTRAVLCSSYNDQDTWLNPKLSAFVIESYSMTVANMLRQSFNLDRDLRSVMFGPESKFVQTLFAAYYAQLLGGSQAPLDLPPLLYRCPFLGSVAEIQERLESIRELRPNNGNSPLTINLICEILAQAGPARMSNFTAAQLFRMFSIGSTDSQSMLVALEYPPYWVYQLMRSAAGSKNPIITNVIKIHGYKAKVNQFATELNISGGLVEKVNR